MLQLCPLHADGMGWLFEFPLPEAVIAQDQLGPGVFPRLLRVVKVAETSLIILFLLFARTAGESKKMAGTSAYIGLVK